MSDKNWRETCLDTAKEYVTKDRTSTYGTPEDNFQDIADLWDALGIVSINRRLGVRKLTATDVALMMAAMKLARLKGNPSHVDSWVDTAGYAACGLELSQLQLKREEEDQP